jgi:hypothetical protein
MTNRRGSRSIVANGSSIPPRQQIQPHNRGAAHQESKQVKSAGKGRTCLPCDEAHIRLHHGALPWSRQKCQSLVRHLRAGEYLLQAQASDAIRNGLTPGACLNCGNAGDPDRSSTKNKDVFPTFGTKNNRYKTQVV